MGKRVNKPAEPKRDKLDLAKRFSLKWSIISWLVSTAVFVYMCINYTAIMEQGGGNLYRILTVLMGAVSLYRLILIIYNIIQKRKEK